MSVCSVGQIKRVEVSPKILETASRLFNSTLEDITNELLQNSRRAGATQIKIKTYQSDSLWWLVFEDDGVGIFGNGISITLGQSSWDEQTRQQEDPAGMGLFSLAARGARLESNNYRVDLSPEHFNGQKEFEVQPSDLLVGTKTTFVVTSQELNRVEYNVSNCAKYYPLPVYLNGEKIKQADFLSEAMFIQCWRGIEIGVVSTCSPDQLNFYGLTVNQQLPIVENCHGNTYGVKINVKDCTELKLVLPARKEVVADNFFAALAQECERTIYLYIAGMESHQLPYKNWQQAAKLGVQLPEAQPKLLPYQPPRADDESQDELIESENPGNGLLMCAELMPAKAQTFWRGFTRSSSQFELYETQPKLRGYSWYDNLPQLTEVELAIELAGQFYSLDHWLESLDGERPDNIWVSAKIVNPDQSETVWRCRSDLLLEEHLDFFGFAESDLEQAKIIVTKDSDLSVAELADILDAALFDPCEDLEADSIYTQHEYFQARATEIAIALLCSPEEAIDYQLRRVFERHIRSLIPGDCQIKLTCERERVYIEQIAKIKD